MAVTVRFLGLDEVLVLSRSRSKVFSIKPIWHFHIFTCRSLTKSRGVFRDPKLYRGPSNCPKLFHSIKRKSRAGSFHGVVRGHSKMTSHKLRYFLTPSVMLKWLFNLHLYTTCLKSEEFLPRFRYIFFKCYLSSTLKGLLSVNKHLIWLLHKI